MTTSPMPAEARRHSARLEVDYPERLDRFTTFFRLIWVIPIAVVLGGITASGNQTVVTARGNTLPAVTPWDYVWKRYVSAAGEPWR